ncbi:MAG: pyruvate kinase alpha/beta domain-containing protein [Candidatus Bathyarchaeia archaeon]
MKIEKIVYFDKPGVENTDETLRLAKERAEALGIKNIVVASRTGTTGIKACKIFKGYNLVIVRHHTGYLKPGFQEMSKEIEKTLIENEAKILTTSHSLSGIERAIRFKRGTIGFLELIADTLRLFGQGVKVCIEIAVMASDAGLIPMDKEIIAIAGTDSGADTALVLSPAHSNNFFDLAVKEIIAKPREIH